MVSTEYEFPDVMDPNEATFEDWAFFSRNIWRKDIDIATLHVGWSNNYDIQNGHYICRLIINQDWANPVEEIHTRDSGAVNAWVFDRLFHLEGGVGD